MCAHIHTIFQHSWHSNKILSSNFENAGKVAQHFNLGHYQSLATQSYTENFRNSQQNFLPHYSQILLSKRKRRACLCSQGVEDGPLRGTEGEVCVSSVTGDTFSYQTPGPQQLGTATLERFLLTSKQTHRFCSRPRSCVLLIANKQYISNTK